MCPRTYQVNLNYNISLPVYSEIKESEKYRTRKELV